MPLGHEPQTRGHPENQGAVEIIFGCDVLEQDDGIGARHGQLKWAGHAEVTGVGFQVEVEHDAGRSHDDRLPGLVTHPGADQGPAVAGIVQRRGVTLGAHAELPTGDDDQGQNGGQQTGGGPFAPRHVALEGRIRIGSR